MATFEKERVAELFGLKVKDIFFAQHLEDTRASRIRAGKNSVSFFIQTSWIKNIPYVHSHPRLAFLLGTIIIIIISTIIILIYSFICNIS